MGQETPHGQDLQLKEAEIQLTLGALRLGIEAPSLESSGLGTLCLRASTTTCRLINVICAKRT